MLITHKILILSHITVKIRLKSQGAGESYQHVFNTYEQVINIYKRIINTFRADV